jgi:NAD(P)-dependent dehydrogenase (short-subunit alcohol dehydrogenase family)
MELGLEAKVAVLAGGTGGLGKATAHRLLQEGASIAVCIRSQANVDAAIAELAARYGADRVMGGAANVGGGAAVEAFVAAVQKRFGRIDILVFAAGTGRRSTIETLTMPSFSCMSTIHERPDEAKAVMAEEFPNLTPEDNAMVYEAMAATWPRNARMNLGQAERTIASMTELAELEGEVDPTPLFSNELMP